MTATQTTSLTPTQVAVLDAGREGQRSLAAVVAEATRLPIKEAEDLAALTTLLSEGDFTVAVVAYEALWPEPRRTARRLRAKTPDVRLVVVHSERKTLRRLGEQLWLRGAFDFFIPRSTPAHSFRTTVRQAHCDALFDNDEEAPTPADESASMRFLDHTSAAFTNQSRVNGLLRELRTRLYRYIEYDLLQVLVMDPVTGDGALHEFPTRRLVHEVIWDLAGQVCKVVEPYADHELAPGSLPVVDAPLLDSMPPSGKGPATAANGLALPMVQSGELIGAIGLLPRSPKGISSDQLETLKLVTYQLATSMRNAQSLRITEQLHRELAKLQEEAHADRLEAVATVIAGQAHEITTPISSARTAAQMATASAGSLVKLLKQEKNEDTEEEIEEQVEELTEACDLVERNISRAFTLIKAFRNQSARQLSDDVMMVDLKEVLSDCIYAMRPETKKKGVVARLEAPEKGSTLWNGYPGQLTQVIVNFFQNVLRYAYPDGRGPIEIILSKPSMGMFKIEFKDFGVGIDPQMVPLVFEPMVTSAAGRGGTGIGLSIAKEIIVKQLKGTIHCASEVGKGTTMTIDIPQDVADDVDVDDDE